MYRREVVYVCVNVFFSLHSSLRTRHEYRALTARGSFIVVCNTLSLFLSFTSSRARELLKVQKIINIYIYVCISNRRLHLVPWPSDNDSSGQEKRQGKRIKPASFKDKIIIIVYVVCRDVQNASFTFADRGYSSNSQ